MSHTSSTPETIGKYEIVGALGRGSMGVVYKGVDREIVRTVAIKTLRKVGVNSKGGSSALERFKIEARSAGNLRHPNIITVFDVNVEAETPYIVMDYVEGRSLHSILKERGKLSLDETLNLLSQIAAGLDAAHASSIIHRDIKPSNLMLDAQGQIYILDFGVARINQEMNASDGEQVSEPVMGTPGYMSPEQILNEKLDARSDLFALAIVAFEMLTGKRPYGGKNFTEIVSNILNSKAESLTRYAPDMPLALEVEFERALSRDREQRFSSAAQMVKAFQVAVGVQGASSQGNASRGLIRPRKASEWKTIKVPDGEESLSRSPNLGGGNPGSVNPSPNSVAHSVPAPKLKPVGDSHREYSDVNPGGSLFAGAEQSLAGAGSLSGHVGSPLVRTVTVLVGLLCMVLGAAIVYTLMTKDTGTTDQSNTQSVAVNHNVDLPVIPSLDTLGTLRVIKPVDIPAGKTVSEMEDEQVLSVLLRDDLDEAVMLDALREASSRGLPDIVDACAKTLGHDSYVVRLETLKLLGRLKDRRIIPVMLESLDDHDPLVRVQATKSLSQLGSRSAISYLRSRYMKEEVPHVKAAIKVAIEKINGFPMN